MLRRSRGGDAKETVAGAKEAVEQEEAEGVKGVNWQCKEGDGSGGRRGQ